MQTECARQLCDGEAIAVCAIDPSSTTVVLLPLGTSVVGSPLCRRHTDGLKPPAGWQLRDERPATPVVATTGLTSDAPDAWEGSEPAEVAETAENPASSTARDDGFSSLLEADTPLLSRAFRTAGR